MLYECSMDTERDDYSKSLGWEDQTVRFVDMCVYVK